MFPKSLWKDTTDAAVDLIKALLQVKRRKRLSVDKMLSHPWLQDFSTWQRCRALEKQLDTRFLTHESDDERWMEYAKLNKLKIEN